MPELPEVQTVVNGLQSLIGDTIIDFWSDWERALRNENGNISAKKFTEQIRNKKIISIERFGKNIFINLSGNITLSVHLRMTGQLLIVERETWNVKRKNTSNKYENHIHHVFYLKRSRKSNAVIPANAGIQDTESLRIPDPAKGRAQQVRNDTYILAFSDIRKFATLKVVPTSEINVLKQKSGIDPFDKNFTFSTFQKLIEDRKNKTVKDFLMDQTIISGIGNIYASEIPFDAKINPTRKISSLNIKEQKKLFSSIKKILKKAIELRGTSFSDYRDSAGQKGAFQNMLKVYKRDKQKCKTCDTIITRIVIGQRSTFYCANCQK